MNLVRTGLVLALLAIAASCDRAAPPLPQPAAPTPAGEPITRKTESGPVAATVTLTPAHPTLGDRLSLTLHVEAEPRVEVRMPSFGEALGRFEIADFAPRSRPRPNGGLVAEQEYTLETPLGGRHVIPPLLVEFTDRREGRPPDSDPDAIHELLTEKISFEVAPPPEGADSADALRPARGPLPPRTPEPMPPEHAVIGLVVLLALAAAPAFFLVRHVLRLRRRRTAYDVAVARLRRLEARGTSAAATDAWYVEISDIVRRYLEDRYGLRAPERTTEEFLREAGQSSHFLPRHRDLLRRFLQRCDHVKFAAYRPGAADADASLEDAHSFLEETRLGAPWIPAPDPTPTLTRNEP